MIKGLGYECSNTDEVRKRHNEESREAAAAGKRRRRKKTFSLVTLANNFRRSILSNVDVYINSRQIYNSEGLYAYKSYLFSNFNGTISEFKRKLHCVEFDDEEFPEDNMEAPSSDLFLTSRMKTISRPDSFVSHGVLGVDIFATSHLLYLQIEMRRRPMERNEFFI